MEYTLTVCVLITQGLERGIMVVASETGRERYGRQAGCGNVVCGRYWRKGSLRQSFGCILVLTVFMIPSILKTAMNRSPNDIP